MTLPIVLVHGGAHGAWCWEPTRSCLEGTVLAVDLPPKAIRGVPAPDPVPAELATTTLDDFATSTIADIDAAGIDRFVLVGHSMGGLTLAEVAARIPERVTHLVFVSCMVPPEGGRVAEGVPSHSREAVTQLLEQLGAGSFPSVRMDDATITSMFCNDMTPEQTRFVLDHTGLEVGPLFGEKVSRSGVPAHLPKTYVRLARDDALSPSDQDEAIARLRECPGGDVEVVELDTGHNVMISAPDQLAPILDAIAARHDS
jgi:pimeloyl-ACP methyl ester carboxylesterase